MPNRRIWIRTLTFMGELFLWQGEIEKAQTLILEALAIAEENNLEWRQLQAWKVLGIMANMQADYAQALHYLTQIQDRNPTMEWFKKSVEIWLGLTVYGLGQYGLARQHLVSGLRHRRVALDGLSLAALLFNQAGHPERATILLALAFHASQRGYTLVWGTKHPLVLRLKEALAEALPPDVFAAAWEQGQRLDLAETVTDLLTELEAEAKTSNPNPRHTKRSEKHH